MKPLDRPFVAVRWADAHGSATIEYAEHELPHRAAHYTAYGFLLRKTDEGVTLTTEHSDEHTYRGVNFIPAAMIIEVTYFNLTRPRGRTNKGVGGGNSRRRRVHSDSSSGRDGLPNKTTPEATRDDAGDSGDEGPARS